MARMILKERQFEPTGVNLGDFESKDLETFDIQFKDSDKHEDSDNNEKSNAPQSHVPNPVDPEPLKQDNESSSGNAGDSSSSSQENNQPKGEEDKDQGLSDMPKEWDPYGDNPDERDNDIPDPVQGDSDDFGGGGSSTQSGGVQDNPSDDGGNDSDNMSSDGSSSSDSDDSQDGENGSSNDGSNDSEDEESNDSGNGPSDGVGNDTDADFSDMEGDSQNSNSMSNGEASSSSNTASDDSQEGEGSSDRESSSSDSNMMGSNKDSGGGDSQQNSAKDDPNSGLTYDPNASQEEDNEDFDPAGDIKSISDLEKALEKMDKNETNTSKEKRKTDEEQTKADDSQRDNPRNKGQQQMRDRQEEAAAAKEILSKAIQDKKERDRERQENGEKVDEPRVSDDIYESEDDILNDLGAGNLTTLFNPSNARDWRVQLDRLFDRALGFDVITNPNLVNKKIEDAPPGREDFDPVIKNIVILLDYSGSMGAIQFKQVISHIDTMLKARKLTKTTFHIFPWGSTDAGTLLDRYTKCKGLMFKKTINAKFKKGSGGTHLAPVIPIVMKKVHRPDAIIIMTDAEISDPSAFDSSPMCKSFVKKFKNRIIWALTSNARVDNVTRFDPTARAKKRYIKFKKGGSESDYD